MDDVVATLSDEECWQLLAGEELGRLVTRVGDVLDIFPVNYVVDEDTIVFRTAEGVEWKGRRYASLSAVARAITGTRRNGPAFFGLREAARP